MSTRKGNTTTLTGVLYPDSYHFVVLVYAYDTHDYELEMLNIGDKYYDMEGNIVPNSSRYEEVHIYNSDKWNDGSGAMPISEQLQDQDGDASNSPSEDSSGSHDGSGGGCNLGWGVAISLSLGSLAFKKKSK